MRPATAAALGLGLLTLALPPAPGSNPEPPPKPVNLGNVNTAADEVDPFLAPGGLHLYYASNASGKFKILVSRRARASQTTFPAGKVVKELDPGKRADARSPFLTREGKFYFAGDATPRGPKENYDRNFDLYLSYKYSYRDPFTQPTPLLGVDTEADELHPWVTARGKEFYFSRKTKAGWRVYVAKGPALGAVSEARLVNLPADFHHPTLTPSGLTMYLQGPVGRGRWGLFRTSRARVGGAWSRPVALSDLNSPDAPRGDLAPGLSPDGSWLYFASDRPGGKGGLDLWKVPTARLRRK